VNSQTTRLDQAIERVIATHASWERQRREVQSEDRDASNQPALSIALARQAGTQGTLVAHEIGARLNWPVYDRELLELIAGKAGLRASLLESVDERRKSWLLEWIEAFASLPGISEIGYSRLLVETVLSLGALGHCVFVGRGAAQILPPQYTLRVYLVGALSDRVDYISKDRGLPHDEAERFVKEKDHESIEFVKSHFFKDPTDPMQCDLLLNRSRWSITECADLIIQAVPMAESRLEKVGAFDLRVAS